MSIIVGWVTAYKDGEGEMHLIPLPEDDDKEAALQLSGHEKHRECFCYPHKADGKEGWEGWTMWHHKDSPASVQSMPMPSS